MDYYNDADDRYIAELNEEDEVEFINLWMMVNEDYLVPVVIINGVCYY